jgi:hypothetical protein
MVFYLGVWGLGRSGCDSCEGSKEICEPCIRSGRERSENQVECWKRVKIKLKKMLRQLAEWEDIFFKIDLKKIFVLF